MSCRPVPAPRLVGELCAEVLAAGGAPPSLRDLLLKAVTRRAALRGKVSAAQVRALFEIEPVAQRLAVRTRKVLQSVGVAGAEDAAAAPLSDAGVQQNQSKRAASTRRKPVRGREHVT